MASAGSGAVPSWGWKDGGSLLGPAAGKGQSGTCPKAPLPAWLGHPSWAFCGPRYAFGGASESGQRNGAAGWPLALAWFRVERWGEQLGAGLVMTEQDGLALVTACPAPGSHTWTQQAGPPRQLPAPAIPAWRKARGFHRAVCPLPSLRALTLHTAVPTRAHMYGARLLGVLEPAAPPLPSSQWSRPPRWRWVGPVLLPPRTSCDPETRAFQREPQESLTELAGRLAGPVGKLPEGEGRGRSPFGKAKGLGSGEVPSECPQKVLCCPHGFRAGKHLLPVIPEPSLSI